MLVGEHTIDETLLPESPNILDLGCRGFDFEKHFGGVYSVDIDLLEGDYYRLAISNKNGYVGIANTLDPQARHIIEGNAIEAVTIEEFSKRVGVNHWDLIKIDIEGEEYNILKDSKHPLATQVSVEFHAHCGVQTKESLDELLIYLSQYYTVHGAVWESRHGAGYNYWDVLLKAK